MTADGVSTRQAALLTGLVRSTAIRHSIAAAAPTPVVMPQRASDPVNKLTVSERLRILAVLTGTRFVDMAPLQIYAHLLDEGVYLCSVFTMYRVLAENTQVRERRRLARHPAAVCPELVATAARQVYTCDITKLAGPVKGTYFDAYLMIDIYSRFIVGVHVHAHESGVLAKELMEGAGIRVPHARRSLMAQPPHGVDEGGPDRPSWVASADAVLQRGQRGQRDEGAVGGELLGVGPAGVGILARRWASAVSAARSPSRASRSSSVMSSCSRICSMPFLTANSCPALDCLGR
jgi:hypothetical protein